MTNRLAFFPISYEDEDFKSLSYRYHKRSTNVSIKHTLNELFNVKTHKLPHFPHNLSFFVRKLPDSDILTLDYIIEKHTLLALFLPFFSTQTITEVLSDVKSFSDGSRISTRMLSPIISSLVYYCPICLKEDFERLGECYIHRVHQYNFVNVCPDHDSILITHCPECGILLSNDSVPFFLTEPICPNGHFLGNNIETKMSKPIQVFNQQLARDVSYILNNVGNLNVDFIKQRMQKWATYHQYFMPTGALDNLKLFEHLKTRFSKAQLSTIGFSLEYLSQRTAQKLLKINGKVKNPLLYILGMQILGGSVEDFMFGEIPKITLREGPWHCINPFCPNFNKPNLYEFKHKYKKKTKSIIGEYICSKCGYQYTLSENEETTSSNVLVLSIGWRAAIHILDYFIQNKNLDKVFKSLRVKPRQRMIAENKARYVIKTSKQLSFDLTRLISIGGQVNSLEQLLLNTSDIPLFIKDYLKKPFGWKYGEKSEAELERDKQKLLESIKSCKDRKSIRQKVGSDCYNRLIKKDYVWMEKVLLPHDYNFKQLDWSKIDEELVIMLNKIILEIYSDPPFTRIQKYTILRRLPSRDKVRIERHPHQLPKTIKFIETAIESIESYQLRKIPKIIEQINMSTTALNLNNVLKNPIYKGCSERVKKKISEELLGLHI